jgi:ADP-ribose pyrophosphatase
MTNANDAARIQRYLEFARANPELFVTPSGGARILLDPTQIVEVEGTMRRKLEARGLPPEGADVGVVLRDPWFYVLRDAVEFPDGSRRTHARAINRVGNGAAALPVLGGRIVLARHFRHAVRRWMLEIPRGGIEPGRSPEDTARAELGEEIGGVARRVVPLGFLHGTSNLYASGAHLFFAELESVGAPQIGEGIAAIEQLSVPEFEARLLAGEITDSFTVAAFTHARLRGLL